MITLLAFSKNQQMQYMLAYQEGVYTFRFTGDLTYTDALSNVWTWAGVANQAPQIAGIRVEGVPLVQTANITECKAFAASYFYDGTTLYVHWPASAGDWALNRSATVRQDSSLLAADSFDPITGNFWGGQFYSPVLNSVSGVQLTADPLKLGLLGEIDVSFDLDNSQGQFDFIDDTLARGSVCQVSMIPEGEADITQAKRTFTGYSSGLKLSNKTLQIQAIEQRFFQNAEVCINLLTVADFANLDDDLVGKRKPVALGDIRQGIAVPVNSKGVDRADTGSITFLLSDPALGPLRAVSKLWDNNGSELTGFSVNLTACTVAWTKPANIDVDLKKFRWTGQGHNLGFGAYNNGVDIMRYAFQTFAQVANVSTTFDDQAWIDTAAANPQAVGLSMWSDKGITEEIIEPVCTSLQVLVFTLGNGQLTIRGRDILQDAVRYVDAREYVTPVSVNYDTRGFMNSLTVQYAPDFVDNKKIIDVTNSTYKADIIRDYGNLTTSRVSPIKTVLYAEADAIALAEEIMQTSKRPDKVVSVTVAGFKWVPDLVPFDILDLPLQRDANNEGPDDIRRVEVLSVKIDSDRQTAEIQGRIVGSYPYLVGENGEYLTTMTGDYLIGNAILEA
jgi:hypothetical protein